MPLETPAFNLDKHRSRVNNGNIISSQLLGIIEIYPDKLPVSITPKPAGRLRRGRGSVQLQDEVEAQSPKPIIPVLEPAWQPSDVPLDKSCHQHFPWILTAVDTAQLQFLWRHQQRGGSGLTMAQVQHGNPKN